MVCGVLCVLTPVVGLVLLYKLLEHLLRWPRLGGLSDRYVLITGCDTGFGKLLTEERLDGLGCHVFAGCLTEKGETQLNKSCSGRVVTLQMDVTRPDHVKRALEIVTTKLKADGGKDLWAVVNNAGLCNYCGPPEWLTVDNYRTTADVNLYGLIDVTMTFLPLLKKSRGRVVNMSSMAGRISMFGIYLYGVSKYGVEAFTDGIRRSLRPFGVKAIVMEPGYHRTLLIDRDLFRARVERAWNQASQESKEEYGEEYCNYLKTDLAEKSHMLASDRVSDVIDAYENAILARYPRPRYAVGFDALFVWRVIQVLPEWLGDWILDVLDKDKPLPAAVRKR